jgi:hypothetical protein
MLHLYLMLLIACPLGQALGQTSAFPVRTSALADYDRYTNQRFGFSIQYPHFLKIHEEPTNGDGVGFTSEDGTAALTVFASNTLPGDTVEMVYQAAMKEVHGSLGYTRLAPTWFVITWKDAINISYRKTLVGAGSQNTFILSYPQTQKAAYANTVINIGKSFGPGNLSQPH